MVPIYSSTILQVVAENVDAFKMIQDPCIFCWCPVHPVWDILCQLLNNTNIDQNLHTKFPLNAQMPATITLGHHNLYMLT